MNPLRFVQTLLQMKIISQSELKIRDWLPILVFSCPGRGDRFAFPLFISQYSASIRGCPFTGACNPLELCLYKLRG
jgi:hypothetical protein